jgi:fatty-acyl-CoA synthase
MEGDLHRPAFVADILITALGRDPSRPALQLESRVMTCAELRDDISRLVQALAVLSIGPGCPVAILSANRPEVVVAMGATMVAGARTTPLHPLGSLNDHVNDANIETLVFDPTTFDERAAQLAERVPSLRNLLALGRSEVGHDLLRAAGAFGATGLRAPAVRADDNANLVYTGGTTGTPKGVILTQRGVAAMTAIQMAEWHFTPEARLLISTPLSHSGAAFLLPALLKSGSLIVLPGFDPERLLDMIERHRVTDTMVVPTMLYALLDHPKLDRVDLSSLKTIYYGGAAISPARLQEAVDRLGQRFFQFYGQSECPMTVTVLRKHEHDRDRLERLGSCGRPVPWVHTALLDDHGDNVVSGDPGEICVRGPLVMGGYWNKPAETEAALEFGWLHTGDVARTDDEGFLTIIDRTKDMIVTGGFNVFPREIEDVISAHADVAAVAVIGIPDERWGEAVKAIVVTRKGHDIRPAELIDLVRHSKGAVQAPKTIDIVEAIPLSTLGKPDKKALRATYWSGAHRLVH